MTAQWPLHWPADWPRSKAPERSRFKATISSAIKFLQNELRLIGATNVVISSNVSLRSNRPEDPGVAVYFTLGDQQLCMPCDRYAYPEDNLQAIAKTIEAMRGIERWDAKNTIRRAFSGFKSSPPPGGNPDEIDWRNTLLCAAGATFEEAQAAHCRLAKENHPDKGGSSDRMMRLHAALEAARKEFGE